MKLTVNSKIKDLMANAEARAEVDLICPGLTTHPSLGLAKNMTLTACARLLPDTLTPEVMNKIAEMLERVCAGEADGPEEKAEAKITKAAKKDGPEFDFDEVIDREGTNSVKYSTGCILNPWLPQEHIPMWIADMDFACPQPILDAMKARLDRRILGYSQVLDPDYYLAVIDWMKRRHNIDTDFDSIVYSHGVIPAMEVAVERLTRPDEGVIINTPAYHPFDESVKKFGRRPVYSKLINTDGYYTIDFEDFEEKARDPKNTLYFLCSPHNPSGRVWTEEELRRVADICFENNVFIFCDEIHADLIRKGQKHISLMTLYPGEKRLITATAPSKTFNLAGNQLANILIPDHELANDWRMGMYCGLPNPLSVDACKAAYTDPACERWLDALRDYLDGNLRYVDECIRKFMPEAVFRIPEGTYLCWIDLRKLGMTDMEMKEKVSRAGLFIEYADEFVADGEGFVRMNIACPRSVLKKAMKILCTTLGTGWEDEPEPVQAPELSKAGAEAEEGGKAPDFRFRTAFADDLSLYGSLSRTGSTALVFMRYYGCTICRGALAELKQQYERIQEKGGKVLVVMQSSAELLRKALAEEPMPFDIISDPDAELYELYNVGCAADAKALVGGLRGKKKIRSAKAMGYSHGEYEGRELQLPAVFIISSDGSIKKACRPASIAKMPDAGKICSMM